MCELDESAPKVMSTLPAGFKGMTIANPGQEQRWDFLIS